MKNFINIFILLCALGNSNKVWTQSPFNVVNDHAGPYGQCMNWMVAADSQYIYTIGDFTDSSSTAVLPYTAVYDYQGNVIRLDTLVDTTYPGRFNVKKRELIHFNNTRYLYLAAVVNGHMYFDEYVADIDLLTGQVINSKAFNIEEVGALDNLYTDGSNRIGLIFRKSLGENHDSTLLTYVEMDSSFNITHEFDWVFKNGLWGAKYIEFQENGITMVGNRLTGLEASRFKEGAIGWMNVKEEGAKVEYLEIEYDTNLSIGSAEGTMVYPNNKGGYDITCSTFFDDTSIPVVISTSEEFNNPDWIEQFFKRGDYNDPFLKFSSNLAAVDEGSISVGIYYESSKDTTRLWGYWTTLVFKVSSDGDSLWSRRIVPGGFDPGRSVSGAARHAIASPYGGVIVAGGFSDLEEYRKRSFLMHLDSNGCIIPGCNDKTNTTSDVAEDKFSLYPNPASDVVYILNSGLQGIHNIRLITGNGALLKEEVRSLQLGDQIVYFLPSNLSSGQCFLQFQSEESGAVYTQAFIVSK